MSIPKSTLYPGAYFLLGVHIMPGSKAHHFIENGCDYVAAAHPNSKTLTRKEAGLIEAKNIIKEGIRQAIHRGELIPAKQEKD